MGTEGYRMLARLPLLQRLARLHPDPVRNAGLIVLAGLLAAVLAAIPSPAAGHPLWVDPRAVLGLRTGNAGLILASAMNLAIALLLVAWFEQDLERFDDGTPLDAGAIPDLAIRPLAFAGWCLASFVLLSAGFHALHVVTMNVALDFRYLAALGEGPASIMFWYLTLPLLTVAFALGWVVLLVQSRVLWALAGTLDAGVDRARDNHEISGTFLRFLGAATIMVSAFGAGLVFLDLPSETVAGASLALILALLPLPILTFRPVARLRARILASKQEEIRRMQARMNQLDPSDPEERAEHAYLMIRQLFVQQQWEWPIAPQFQRMALLLLLPPLTWVFAAMVEHALF